MVKASRVSVEVLKRQRDDLEKKRTEAVARIEALKIEVDKGVADDGELYERSLSGSDTSRERSKVRQRTEQQKVALNQEVEDLGKLMVKMEGVEQEIVRAKHQGAVDQVAQSAEERRVELTAIAREIPVALREATAHLQQLVTSWESERQIRNNDLGQGFGCPGEVALQRLNYLVAELLHGASMIEGGGTR